MTAAVFVFHTVKTRPEKIPGRHVNRFFVCACACVGIDLSIKNNLSVLVVCPAQNSIFCPAYVIIDSVYQCVKLAVVDLEKRALNKTLSGKR